MYVLAEPSACHKHLMRVLGNTGMVPPGHHMPNCRSDGSYNPVQCEGSTPYCWCVNENGYEILGTRELGQPKCKEISECFPFLLFVLFPNFNLTHIYLFKRWNNPIWILVDSTYTKVWALKSVAKSVAPAKFCFTHAFALVSWNSSCERRTLSVNASKLVFYISNAKEYFLWLGLSF